MDAVAPRPRGRAASGAARATRRFSRGLVAAAGICVRSDIAWRDGAPPMSWGRARLTWRLARRRSRRTTVACCGPSQQRTTIAAGLRAQGCARLDDGLDQGRGGVRVASSCFLGRLMKVCLKREGNGLR